MNKHSYIFALVSVFLLVGCKQEMINDEINLQEKTDLIIRCGFDQSRVSHHDDKGYFKTEWEKGDTITVIINGEYRYYVADHSGAQTTFTLSDEHTDGLKAWSGQEVYALSKKVVIKDGNYALLEESMGSQRYSADHPPMDVQTCKSSINNGVADLSFSYPCSFLRMKMKKKEIEDCEGRIVVRVTGNRPFVLKYADQCVDEEVMIDMTWNAEFVPTLPEDNWSESSVNYPYTILNIAWNKYISYYIYDRNDIIKLGKQICSVFFSKVESV